MKHRARHILLLVVLACAGCVTVGSSLALKPETWDGSCSGDMRAYAFPVGDESTVDCGFLALEASDQDFRDVLGCAKSAVESGKPYRFGYRNIDQYLSFCNVAMRTPDGQLWSLQFYVPILEAMSQRKDLQYSFNAKQCSTITLKNDRRGFFGLQGCNEATDAFMSRLHDKPGS
jgi:hypothetical protein